MATQVDLLPSQASIRITTRDWLLSFDGSNGTFQVDTIDGVAPTSNVDLYNKINALR